MNLEEHILKTFESIRRYFSQLTLNNSKYLRVIPNGAYLDDLFFMQSIPKDNRFEKAIQNDQIIKRLIFTFGNECDSKLYRGIKETEKQSILNCNYSNLAHSMSFSEDIDVARKFGEVLTINHVNINILYLSEVILILKYVILQWSYCIDDDIKSLIEEADDLDEYTQSEFVFQTLRLKNDKLHNFQSKLDFKINPSYIMSQLETTEKEWIVPKGTKFKNINRNNLIFSV